MLSNRQFADALTFVRSYKDAITATEQIAERRAAYAHYEGLTQTLVAGLESGQLKLSEKSVVAGPSAAEFPLVKQVAFAKDLWTKYGLGAVGNREEFVQKLDKACAELQKRA